MVQFHPLGSRYSELLEARRSGAALIFAAFLFSIFVNLLMLTGPLFMLQVYDRVLGSRSEETLTALFLLVGILYFLMALLDFARGRLMARYGAIFQASLDPTVFEASLSSETEKQIGHRDLETIQSLMASPLFLALFDMIWSPFFRKRPVEPRRLSSLDG